MDSLTESTTAGRSMMGSYLAASSATSRRSGSQKARTTAMWKSTATQRAARWATARPKDSSMAEAEDTKGKECGRLAAKYVQYRQAQKSHCD